jgi:hypothetical protein
VAKNLALLGVAGALFASRTSSSLIGGVFAAVFVGGVSRGIARWLARDLVAAVQGAIYGSILGLLVDIALVLLAVIKPETLGQWFLNGKFVAVSLAIAVFVVCTVLGAIRGAFAGRRSKARVGSNVLSRELV